MLLLQIQGAINVQNQWYKMPMGVQNPSLAFANDWSGDLAPFLTPIFLTLIKILTLMVDLMNEVCLTIQSKNCVRPWMNRVNLVTIYIIISEFK